MFETLDSARELKAASPGITRLFFGTYTLAGALGAASNFDRHRLHRPVELGIEILMFTVSLAWFRDSWMAVRPEKFRSRFIFLIILLLLVDFIRGFWY